MTDETQLPEAELAALADGSLPAERRAQLRARIDASPELAAALSEQERAVTMLRALDEPAPAALHARVREMTDGAATPLRAPRWRRSLFVPAATALAVAVAALVVLLEAAAARRPRRSRRPRTWRWPPPPRRRRPRTPRTATCCVCASAGSPSRTTGAPPAGRPPEREPTRSADVAWSPSSTPPTATESATRSSTARRWRWAGASS